MWQDHPQTTPGHGPLQPLLGVECRFFSMIMLLFSVVKGGVSLNTTTVDSSKDVLVFVGASNVGTVAAGGVVTSVVVESPSVDPSNAPPAVVTVATVGVSTALTDQMLNL